MSASRTLKWTASATALIVAMGAPTASAQDLSEETAARAQAAIGEAVRDEAGGRIDAEREAVIADATSALVKTEEALTALDAGDAQAAIDALAIATGKLQTVIAREPALALAPVSTRVIERDLHGDVALVETTREAIEALLDEGRLQEARLLLSDFGSEIVVETTALPLATYPAALLRATAQIDDGAIEEAKRTLTTALATMIVTEDVIPLPILRAEHFIDAAEEALEQADAPEIEAEDGAGAAPALTPREYVQAAREQVRLAEALGYGTEDDFDALHADLERLDDRIGADQDADGILGKLRMGFDRLKSRLGVSDA